MSHDELLRELAGLATLLAPTITAPTDQSGSRDALPRPCPLRTVRAGQSPHTAQASREGVAG